MSAQGNGCPEVAEGADRSRQVVGSRRYCRIWVSAFRFGVEQGSSDERPQEVSDYDPQLTYWNI